MNKSAQTSVPINPLISNRWSPRSFDLDKEVNHDDLLAILEAGRWAPSANNLQPWKFTVGVRGDEVFEKIASTLADFNKLWAPNSSAMILISSEVMKSDGSPIHTALYDAGIAASLMTMEATSRGLHTHQMAGFDRTAMKEAFDLGKNFRHVAVLVIGTLAPADLLTDALKERETAERSRKSLSQISNFH